jgi:hypothetical protein
VTHLVEPDVACSSSQHWRAAAPGEAWQRLGQGGTIDEAEAAAGAWACGRRSRFLVVAGARRRGGEEEGVAERKARRRRREEIKVNQMILEDTSASFLLFQVYFLEDALQTSLCGVVLEDTAADSIITPTRHVGPTAPGTRG